MSCSENINEQLEGGGERRTELFQPAIAKSVELSLLPKNAPSDLYIETWDKIEAVIITFLENT